MSGGDRGRCALAGFCLDVYRAVFDFQRSREDDVLATGIAFPLVRKLLALNAGTAVDAPRVEVILLSRNSSDTRLRIFNSIEHYGLDIARAAFIPRHISPVGTMSSTASFSISSG